MEKWAKQHLNEIRRARDGPTEAWVQRQHKINFTTWIEKQDIPTDSSNEESKLASGLSSQITTWQGYDINGHSFHMKEKDKKSTAYNSGVRYEGINEATRR
jgi:hypothetical protein